MARKGCGGWASKRVREHRDRMFIEQDGKCFHCGCEMNQNYERPNRYTCTADHLLPLADGGRNNRANLVAACAKCNAGRPCQASIDNNELQKNWGLMNQKPRNHQLAAALIEAFGMDHLRDVLRAARRDEPVLKANNGMEPK